jgi:hypothetical protein
MREIKARVPPGMGEIVANLALEQGASSAIYHTVVDAGQKQNKEEVRIKTSSPTARRIVNAVLAAPFYDPAKITLSSHDIRSLLSKDDIVFLTRPFCIPLSDIYQDFWQANHVTFSFVCRVIISAMLLSYAMLKARFVLMIGAMFFTLFSLPLMSFGLAVSLRDTRLMRHSCKAFWVSVVLSVAAAAIVAWAVKGPLLVEDFGTLKGNLFVALASGLVAAVAETDDTGRRQFIAVAAAFPFARFPPWIGISLVLGFPGWHTTLERLSIFGINILSMVFITALTYRLLGEHTPPPAQSSNS